jgi:hypothetical protein
MKRYSCLCGAVAVTLAVASSPKDAHAIGPVDIEAGVKVGGATNPIHTSDVNPLGFGIGGRAGIAVFGLYFGANVMDYVGNGDHLGGIYHSVEAGGEIGYGIKIPLITIRPQVGLGNITFMDTLPLTNNWNSFYVEPGVTILLRLGILFVAGDANALIITNTPNFPSASTDASFTVHGQIGIIL